MEGDRILGRFAQVRVKTFKRKIARSINKFRNRDYFKSLDDFIDNMMIESNQYLHPHDSNKEIVSLDSNTPKSEDPFKTIKENETQADSSIFQSFETQPTPSTDNINTENIPLESTKNEHDYIDEWIDELEKEQDKYSINQDLTQISPIGIVNNIIMPNNDQYSQYGSLSKNINDLDDKEIELLKEQYMKAYYEKGSALLTKMIKPAERRKKIDPRATVKKGIAKNGGSFSRLYYKKSPTLLTDSIKPLDLLIIGDVSGSMGKYVVIVLYLIATLERFANINSYIFSDTPTYVTPFIKTASFAKQYKTLREKATSWEYGTRLSLALEEVIEEKKYKSSTVVLLITDGGISLEGNDWEDTGAGLKNIKSEVQKLLLISPNEELIKEGDDLADNLWRVKSRQDNINFATPYLQKLFRFGILHKYADEKYLCSKIEDIEKILEALIENDKSLK